MKLRAILFLLSTVVCSVSHASMVSYSTIEKFHETKINSILEEYGLEERAKITFSLSSNKSVKKDNSEIIKLPGLLLDAISLNSVKRENGLVEIIDALRDYKRKIVILKTNQVTKKEIQVVTQALSEELYIKSPKSFSVKPWSNQKTWSGEFTDSLYNDVLLSPWTLIGIIAFGIGAFLIFSLSSSILNGFSSLGKSIYEGIENSVGSSESSTKSSPSAEAGLTAEGGVGDAQSSSSAISEEALVAHQSVDCSAVFKLMQSVYQAKPHEFKYKMWESFPTVNQQLNLFVYFESKLSHAELTSFSTFYKELFAMDSSDQSSETKSLSVNLESKLWNMRVVLTHMLVSPLDENLEKALEAVTSDFEGQTDEIIKGSIDDHFKVVSYVFKDKVNDYIGQQSELDDGLSRKIISFLSLSEEGRKPSDIEIRSFETHLKENSHFKADTNATTSYRNVRILQRLPDHILFSDESLDSEARKILSVQVPNFKWLASAGQKTHKKFISALTPNEAAHLVKHYKDYFTFKEELDSRSASRLQELEIKSTQSNSVEIVLGLRSKISRFYQPVEDQKFTPEIVSAA